jgi:riboflavin kinase
LQKKLKGKVTTGFGEGAKYVSIPLYNILLTELLDQQPYPGTLNVEVEKPYTELIEECPALQIKSLIMDGIERGGFYYWFGNLVYKNKDLEVLVIRPFLTKHKENILEIVSGVNFRDELKLKDGNTIGVKLLCNELLKT